jgi:inner membrane transporter RhtA
MLAATGVWFLTRPDEGAASLDPIGICWSLGAATLWAGYILIGRKISVALGNSAAPVTLGIAAILMLPVGIQHAGMGLLAPELLPVALLVALFSAAIPFSLEFFAMPRMPARTFAVMMSLEPAFGVLSGLIILHEYLAVGKLGGIALVIAASAGAIWSSRPKAPTAPTDAPPG